MRLLEACAHIAKNGCAVVCSSAMKTQALNVNLTADLRRYVKDQVRMGRYQDEDEVVRDAIRQMQQREMEQFERLFPDYPGAPQGEPTPEDDKAIKAAIKRYRDAKSTA
jgi:putative addiction module CopG family antidote